MVSASLDNPTTCETISLQELAGLLGLGATVAYELAARNELPVPVFKIGRKYYAFREHYEAFKASHLKNRHTA